MKKGTYIDYNIILACLSHRKKKVNTAAAIHPQLAETLSERSRLFEKYKNDFENTALNIHYQLQQTIREHEYNTQYFNMGMPTRKSQQAA